MESIKTINATAYTDHHGNPTCAVDFTVGKVCAFYRTEYFGMRETCLFAPSRRLLDRRLLNEKPIGTLIPGDWCPLWIKEE